MCNSSNQSHLPVEYTSTSRDVEVHFIAQNMTTLDDPDTVNFEGMFEFVKAPTSCKDGRRKFGPSGTIDMTFGDVSSSDICRVYKLFMRNIFLRWSAAQDPG